MTITWRKEKPLADTKSIEKLEANYQMQIPEDLKSCITAHNGGRPSPNIITTASGDEYDLKLMLSYNPNDIETVYKVMDFFSVQGLLPFAADSGGNYFCIALQTMKIVLWVESGKIIPLCDSFPSFLEMLHQ